MDLLGVVSVETIDSLLDKGDAIGALCLAVEQAGFTMRLHGQPIGAEGLRAAALDSMYHRLVQLAQVNHDPGDEDRQ